jgi:RNA recognition motif-containing protein
MTIYIGNLSPEVTEDHLSSVFAEYGSVKTVKLPVDRETGQMRGFAFVDMATEAEEASAIEDLNDSEWMGNTLKVNVAKPRRQRNFSRRY